MISKQGHVLPSKNCMHILNSETYASACKIFVIARTSRCHNNFIVLHAHVFECKLKNNCIGNSQAIALSKAQCDFLTVTSILTYSHSNMCLIAY